MRKTNRLALLSAKLLLLLLAWTTAFVLLGKYEYFSAFQEIDNLVGILPVALALVFVCGTTYLLLVKHQKKTLALALTVAALTALSVGLFPLALRGNWWINPTTESLSQAAPDLTVYAPFSPNSQAAKQADASALRLSDDLPILDGATALYPVYAAFAEAAYDENAYRPETVVCTNTKGAYQAILNGQADIIFVAKASQKQLEAAEEAGAALHFTPIGREAFVFLVGKENPVDNISFQQIRNIYSGKTARWRTLGWAEGGKIIAFQRPEGSGSQTGLQGLMAGVPIQVPQPLPDAGLIGTNSLMKQVSVEWQGVQPALGYSYRYYATTMYQNPDAKLLAVNGAAPTEENIQNGSYPFVNDFYAVTNGPPQGTAKLLIDWILSPQGQELVEKTGYTPIA